MALPAFETTAKTLNSKPSRQCGSALAQLMELEIARTGTDDPGARLSVRLRTVRYMTLAAIALAAPLMNSATAFGCKTYTAWLPPTSVTVAPARFDIAGTPIGRGKLVGFFVGCAHA